MGRISDDDVRRVREGTDIVALVSERVVLRQKGRLFWGCCPFHQEKTPSFKIDPATQLFHCFGCNAGGDAFGFVMRIENLEFPDAVRALAERARIEIHETEGAGVSRSHKDRLSDASAEAAEFYHRYLVAAKEPGPERARAYLAKRGFGTDVAKRWKLGYAPGRGALVRHLREKGFAPDELIEANLALKSNRDGTLRDRFFERIIFPIADLQGRVIAFGGRIIDKGEPKYLNTQETPIFHKGRNLYAIDVAKADIVASGAAIVVEGYTDVIALHEAGLRNVVATLGTALTREHVRLLGRFAQRVVYLFDGDAAGLRAADRAVEFIDRTMTPEAGRERVELFVAVLPEGADPADFVAKDGAEALKRVVEDAQPLLRFAIDRRLGSYDLSKPEQRARALSDAVSVLAPVKDSTIAADYANYVADVMSRDSSTGLAPISIEDVMRVLRTATPMRTAESPPEEAQGAATIEVVTPQIRAERELAGALAVTPALHVRARELLEADLLTDGVARLVVSAVAEAPRTATQELGTRLGAQDERAGSLIAAAQFEQRSPQQAEDEFEDLVARLRMFDLERRIAAGKARLRRGEGIADEAAYDAVFEQVAAMERELGDLKRRVRDDV
ncbi:MAG: DNA primase [Coriobacteriales bacterium]|nr:DNA primase [Coriobacteriales bacterium]